MDITIRYETVELKFENVPINVYVTTEREIVFYDRVVMPVAMDVEYEFKTYEIEQPYDWKEEGF